MSQASKCTSNLAINDISKLLTDDFENDRSYWGRERTVLLISIINIFWKRKNNFFVNGENLMNMTVCRGVIAKCITSYNEDDCYRFCLVPSITNIFQKNSNVTINSIEKYISGIWTTKFSSTSKINEMILQSKISANWGYSSNYLSFISFLWRIQLMTRNNKRKLKQS